MNDIKRTEQGWGGHFICANRCRFRRNTLLQKDGVNVIVSSVGLMEKQEWLKTVGFETIGAFNRYFETMVWRAKWDGRYWEIDVDEQISVNSPWQINEIDADDKANVMHENIVDEVIEKMKSGVIS